MRKKRLRRRAARTFPSRSERIVFIVSNSNSPAIRAPVKAPVPGSGIPTNRVSAI